MRPGRRQKAVRRILARDAALDRPAARHDVVLREGQPLAGGDANLPLHEVDPGHELRHGMLDLEARVHLEEVELAVAVEEELAGAGIHVAGRLRGAHRGLAHRARAAPASRRRSAPPRSSSGGGAAPSTRARRATACCRACRRAPGSRRGAGRRCTSRRRPRRRRRRSSPRGAPRRAPTSISPALAHDAHALPAAARRRLEQHRDSRTARRSARASSASRERLGRARNHGHVGGDRELARRGLAAHRGDRLGRRADERRAPRRAPRARTTRARRGSRSRDGSPGRRCRCAASMMRSPLR